MNVCVKISVVLLSAVSVGAYAESRETFPGAILSSGKSLEVASANQKVSSFKHELLSKKAVYVSDTRVALSSQSYSRSRSLCRRAVVRRLKKSIGGHVTCTDNFTLKASEIPNDSLYSLQYAPSLMAVPSAWDVEKGNPELLALVIDSGIDFSHPDLAGNMWTNPREVPANNRDDDGNGYVDDVYGINTITRMGSGKDDNGHGTHVAGIIGAVGNNTLGVSGISQRVRLVSLKFLDYTGRGSTSNAIRAINYGIELKKLGHKVVVMNNSYGSSSFSKPFYDAVQAASNEGILFTAAAGNSAINNDVYSTYPANFAIPNVISVASVDSAGKLSSFSNYGRTKVHAAAPGSGILSTIPYEKYGYKSGTSMATPQISGLIALTKSACLTNDMLALRSLIVDNGVPNSSLLSKTVKGTVTNAAGSVYAARASCANVATPSPDVTATSTPSPTPTSTPTSTMTPTRTPTSTPTSTPTATPTPNVVHTPRASISPSLSKAGATVTLNISAPNHVGQRLKVDILLRNVYGTTYICPTSYVSLTQAQRSVSVNIPLDAQHFTRIQILLRATNYSYAPYVTMSSAIAKTIDNNILSSVCNSLNSQIK